MDEYDLSYIKGPLDPGSQRVSIVFGWFSTQDNKSKQEMNNVDLISKGRRCSGCAGDKGKRSGFGVEKRP